MIKLHCYQGDILTMKQEIMTKDFLDIGLDQTYTKL